MGAAIAQWILLRQPFSSPGFEYKAHHLCFIVNIVLYLSLYWKKDDNKHKQAHFLKKYDKFK